MKIKTVRKSFDEVMALPRPKHKKPMRPWLLLTTVVRLLAQIDMMRTKFSYTFKDKENLPEGPYLILMNHSSFIDLKIASKILYPMPYGIVCTSDSLVGKSWLMRRLGCIPTQKYVSDMTLIRDIKYALKNKNMSVLMYPEAGYSFDGTATAIPSNLGSLVKVLNVPVIMITTYGAFAYDPLYNSLQLRKVKVSADVKCLLTKEDIKQKSNEELNKVLLDAFQFDNFKWQYENKVKIDEPFRADGLGKVLYKCTECLCESKMVGKGTHLVCENCGKSYQMDLYGRLETDDGKTKFPHIPDWFSWQRECVKNEIAEGNYLLDSEVEIGMMVDYKAVYMVGKGRLVHNTDGFVLYDANGRELYSQGPLASRGVCADYFWYEIGDVICIGNKDALYYCFLSDSSKVAKTRFAVEEIYKQKKPKKCDN